MFFLGRAENTCDLSFEISELSNEQQTDRCIDECLADLLFDIGRSHHIKRSQIQRKWRWNAKNWNS